MKAALITEIEQIYRDAGYQRKGKPLEEYPVELLRRHLDKLQEGAFPWITGEIIPPNPPLEKGGERATAEGGCPTQAAEASPCPRVPESPPLPVSVSPPLPLPVSPRPGAAGGGGA